MKTLSTFLGIIDRHTVSVTVLALASTHVALVFGLEAEMPADIISIAVIFPIVFSINAAYNRREEALRSLASLRSFAGGLYLAHRDWVSGGAVEAHTRRAAERLEACLTAVRESLTASSNGVGPSGPNVYGELATLSTSIEELRRAGLSASEVSRANQYVRAMMSDFEQLFNIAAYRTPVPLRAYSHVFLNSFPILFGPYFASLSRDYYVLMGYAVAALYSLVLVSLDNIQEKLENPFDSDGVDDVRLDDLGSLALLLREDVGRG